MLFAEDQARLLLVVHTVLAVALVAASTHLVVWMRGFPRGRFRRLAGVRKLALISAALFTLTLVGGNLIYPVYKVRVRAEYLDHPSALMRDRELRAEARARVVARYADTVGREAPDVDTPSDAALTSMNADLPRDAARMARWFDVKEHWVAFGMIMSIACAVLLRAWEPDRESRAIASIAFMMAVAASAAAWFGALVGILVSSYRAVG